MAKHKAQHAAETTPIHWVGAAGRTAVIAGLVLGSVAFVGNGKDVVLSIDGQVSTVQTYGSTVEEVLAKADVPLAPKDEVTPALSAAVRSGSSIQIIKAKPVAVVVDGAHTTVHTTAATVGGVVDELGLPADAKVSESSATKIITLSSPLTILTPKTVTVAVDGTTVEHTTTAVRVSELLTELKLTLGPEDSISVPASSSLLNGMGLKVTRLETNKKITVREPIAFESTQEDDPDLAKGETETKVAGVPGERVFEYVVTVMDGKEITRSTVRESVTREPVDEVILRGTKDPRKEPAKTPPTSGVWQALAECESGGNWSINSGNGYYGGLQFSESSWIGAGGGKYAPLPHQATAAEQIATAEVLKQNGGWGHWPSCSAKLGLS